MNYISNETLPIYIILYRLSMGRAGRVFAQPVQDRVGGFSTGNRLVIVTGLLVRVADGWWSVSGEHNYHQNASKHGEILPDPTKIR